MLDMKFVTAVWSLVTNQHLSNIQAPLYIASLCVVVVTSPSFCPRDSLGFYPSVPSFFPCPLILIPTQSELFVKTPPRDEWMDTQRRIQLPANTIALITGVEKCKQMRSPCKNVLMSDVRETKQDVGSDHLNGDQPQCLLLNPPGLCCMR